MRFSLRVAGIAQVSRNFHYRCSGATLKALLSMAPPRVRDIQKKKLIRCRPEEAVPVRQWLNNFELAGRFVGGDVLKALRNASIRFDASIRPSFFCKIGAADLAEFTEHTRDSKVDVRFLLSEGESSELHTLDLDGLRRYIEIEGAAHAITAQEIRDNLDPLFSAELVVSSSYALAGSLGTELMALWPELHSRKVPTALKIGADFKESSFSILKHTRFLTGMAHDMARIANSRPSDLDDLAIRRMLYSLPCPFVLVYWLTDEAIVHPFLKVENEVLSLPPLEAGSAEDNISAMAYNSLVDFPLSILQGTLPGFAASRTAGHAMKAAKHWKGDLVLWEREKHLSAETDRMTGMLDQVAFFKRLQHYIDLAEQNKSPFSILIADIDKFKSINDNFGHSAGDEAIRQLAAILAALVQPGDIVSRYGGEEFAWILGGKSIEAALSEAERIRLRVESNSFTLKDGREIRFTCSLGCAQYIPGEEAITLFNRADHFTILAKERGRNRVEPSRVD